MVEKIKVELEAINTQGQVNIVDKDDIATLVAEKLYNKIKVDLVNSGTGFIGQVNSYGKSFFLKSLMRHFSEIIRNYQQC